MNTVDRIVAAIALLTVLVLVLLAQWQPAPGSRQAATETQQEVVFWHFWGGEDRKVVERVVERFNARQQNYRVRAIAMPGNNLDLKVFLAVTGGDPPDLINQDDPILGDWASRGALLPLDEIASDDEIQLLNEWLFPAARRLGTYDGRLYGLCNGLDIRALYYNQTALEQRGESPPQTLQQLDALAERITPPGNQRRDQYAFLPDARRLWAWGPVFGGGFQADEQGRVTIDSPEHQAALDWMLTYRERYGRDNLAAFRTGDQSLPGKTFPLLSGRYLMLMDGQWRVRDIRAAQAAQVSRGETPTQYGILPLPPPDGGRSDAGWVNGNFFVIPRGADCAEGAWEFMKFWSGFGGHEKEAAATCVEGGWIPVSQRVVAQSEFQSYLQKEPLFAEFVRLAASENQFPVPVIAGAPLLKRIVEGVGERALYDQHSPNSSELLRQAQREFDQQSQRREQRP